MGKKVFCIVTVALVWLATTCLFWTGYTGIYDDVYYSRYAFLFHRPPVNHWEFRIPAILALRASYLVLGPSEIAACLPTLLASLALLASVAWFVDWPRTLNWQTQSSMILASVLPIDARGRSLPSAIFISAGLLAVGTVCILKGTKRTQFLGAVLLAIAFVTHEVSFFYVAIFCLTAVAFDWQRFWRPVLACVVISAIFFLAECTAYQILLDEPLARFKTAAATTTKMPVAYDPDTQIGGLAFFLWPLRNLVFCKQFGFDLIALLICGLVAWKHLNTPQRILFTTVFLLWLWLGYGSQVPWAYKPLYRQLQYYKPLDLGITALLPFALAYALAQRPRIAQGILGAVVAVHLLSLAAGSRFGETAYVAKELLRYAEAHPNEVFLTDAATMNGMYVVGGFQLPENVVCLNGRGAEKKLLVNVEPPNTPKYRFPERPIDGILVNLEQEYIDGFEDEYTSYLKEHGREHARIVAIRYRLLFLPFVRFISPKGFMVRSLGGELVTVKTGS
jgi:hypothetical protein